jgi:hypothetical protein
MAVGFPVMTRLPRHAVIIIYCLNCPLGTFAEAISLSRVMLRKTLRP